MHALVELIFRLYKMCREKEQIKMLIREQISLSLSPPSFPPSLAHEAKVVSE